MIQSAPKMSPLSLPTSSKSLSVMVACHISSTTKKSVAAGLLVLAVLSTVATGRPTTTAVIIEDNRMTLTVQEDFQPPPKLCRSRTGEVSVE